VVTQGFFLTKGAQELKPMLKALRRRYEMLGFEDAQYVWVDDCCESRRLWEVRSFSTFGRTRVQYNRPPDQIRPVCYRVCSRITTATCSQECMPGLRGVLLDILHFIMRLSGGTAGIKHPAFAAFVRDIRDAIYQVLQQDKDKIITELLASGRMTPEAVQFIPQSYFVQTCRRIVRQDLMDMIAKIEAIYLHYKQQIWKVAGTKGRPDRDIPLVSDQSLQVWEQQKAHILKGCISDPPDVSMYIEIKDSSGKVGIVCLSPSCAKSPGAYLLPSLAHQVTGFKSIRGSSDVESYHHEHEELYAGGHTSLARVHAVTQHLNWRHNVRQGIKYRGASP
jgi:hypothetical protein